MLFNILPLFVICIMSIMFSIGPMECLLSNSCCNNCDLLFPYLYIMFFVSRICFLCISSKCCRNISAIVLEIGDNMDTPFQGWDTRILFWDVK